MALLPWLLCAQCLFLYIIPALFSPTPHHSLYMYFPTITHPLSFFLPLPSLSFAPCTPYPSLPSHLLCILHFLSSLSLPLPSSLPSSLPLSLPPSPSLPLYLPTSISDSRASAADTAAVSGGGLPQPRQPQGHPHRQSACGKEPL